MPPRLSSVVRLGLVFAAWVAISAPAAAQVSYTVTFADPNNVFTTTERANMTAAVQATGADWGRYFQTATPTTLSVRITLDNSSFGMTGKSGTTEFVRTVNNTNVFEQSAARKLRTGNSPSAPAFDIELTMNQNYLQSNLYFQSNLTARSEGIPANRTDAYSVFAHELGHAFFMNGWRNGDGSLTTPGSPNYQSTWDQHITREANGDALFRGLNAMAVYGAPVAVTTRNLNDQGNPNHYGNRTGTGSDLVPGYSPNGFVSGLMNGVVFHYQTRYAISALDLAIAKDAGLTLAPFRWSGGTGNWSNAAGWNFTADAGPNQVVPVGTPFDVRLDHQPGTPYTLSLNQSVPLNSLTLASTDATLQHTGGTLSVGTGTLTAGTYQLDGGRIAGGTWTSGGGSIRPTASGANEVSGATLGAGVLNLSAAASYVRLTNGTQFATPAAGTTVGTNAVLALDQSSLARGAITLNDGSLAVEGSRAVTLGPDVTVSVTASGGRGGVGRYAVVSGTGHLTNQGVLQATGANSTLTIHPTGTFTNSGTVRTTDPTATVNIQPGGAFTNTGVVNARGTVTGDVTNTGSGQFFLSGSVSGQLNVDGGVVGAGPDGPGTLTVGSARFGPDGAYRWRVSDWSATATPGVGFDRMTSTGTLDVSQLSTADPFTVRISGLTASGGVGAVEGFDSEVSRSWVIGQFSNDLSGVNPDVFAVDATEFAASNDLNGGSFALRPTESGQLVLTFTPVPEPAAILGVCGLVTGAVVALRRWRRAATPATAA